MSSKFITDVLEYKDCTNPLCQQDNPQSIQNFRFYKEGFRRGVCRSCEAARQREYRSQNPEKHREITRKNVALWRKRHPEREREAMRKYRRKHREHVKHQKMEYKRRKGSRVATLTQEEWETIFAYYNYSCAYCGKAWYELTEKIHREHVIPISQGGNYVKENIVPACHSCNSHKKARTPEQAGMRLLKPLPFK